MRRRFRIGRRTTSGVCERCGTDEHVHRGMCRRCREAVDGGARAPQHAEQAPRQAQPEPLHNPPWRRRGA